MFASPFPSTSASDSTRPSGEPLRDELASYVVPFPSASVSPSLCRGSHKDAPACEMKFLLNESQAAEVAMRLARQMILDPHADLALGGAYRTTTLYCDTPGLDVFHRRGRYKLFKFRVRRYADSEQVYLERKSKRRELVRKRRSTLPLDRLGLLADGAMSLAVDEGAWYQRQLLRNRFQPVCLIAYERMAYYADCDGAAARLTFDRQLRCGAARDWSFEMPLATRSLLDGQVICEFKFRKTLPAMFKSVIADLRLSPGGVSKYRGSLAALGVAAAWGERDA